MGQNDLSNIPWANLGTTRPIVDIGIKWKFSLEMIQAYIFVFDKSSTLDIFFIFLFATLFPRSGIYFLFFYLQHYFPEVFAIF